MGVGDEIIIDLPNIGETRWTVVGLVFDLNGRDQNTAFANIDTLNQALHNVGQGSVVMVQATQQELAVQQAVEKDLRDYFDSQGMEIGYTALAIEDRQQASAQFGILVQVLMVMTILMAVVGSIGLSGTLSINVIERRREIGVMRAVGASSRDVGFVFTGEGLMLGVVSWLFAVPLGMAASPTFVNVLGDVIDFPAEYYPGTRWHFILAGYCNCIIHYRQLGPRSPGYPHQCARKFSIRIILKLRHCEAAFLPRQSPSLMGRSPHFTEFILSLSKDFVRNDIQIEKENLK